MELNKLVVGALIAGGLTAAGGGAYLAVRHNATDAAAPPDAVAEQAAALAVPPPAPGEPVTSSEGVISETEPQADAEAAPPPAPAPSPAPVADEPQPERRPAPPAEPPAPRREPPTPAPAAEALPPIDPPPGVTADGPANGPSMWERRAPVEPVEPAVVGRTPDPPPVPEFLELVVPADSVLGLQIERTLSSEVARVEDRVEARVTRDIRVGDRVAIPAGAIVHGSVTDVDSGGKVRGAARLAVRFHTVVLGDGTELPIRTEAVIREGQSPGGESAAKIGGAALGGAILGAIFGGSRGAAIGGAVGAAGGTAATMAGGRNPAVLPSGTTVSVRIEEPVTVTVDKE